MAPSVQSFFFMEGGSVNAQSLKIYNYTVFVCTWAGSNIIPVSLGCEGKLENHKGMPTEEEGACKHQAERQRDRESNPQH